ncbi:MarR family winged helix-turn-helix transcriptional regulator [Streptomyces sp. YS-3]|uniref:MarR family winged helix-turn-helix transcriptional regulator n=1 Tax=Streptomyces sp. YS-3 TaxID=3381352 RepID=UPI0038625A3B
MSHQAPTSPRSRDVVRVLCAVMEDVALLWEREAHAGSPVLVSPSQLRVLYALERSAGSNLRDLSHTLGSASSALSRLCARLEAMGFVERLPSPRSRREIRLRLTPHATAHLKDLRDRREDALTDVLDAIAPAPRTALTEGVEALRLALDVHLELLTDEQVVRSA